MAVMKNFLYALCIAAAILLATGCRSFWQPGGEGATEQLPWNTPASWEGEIIGVPY